MTPEERIAGVDMADGPDGTAYVLRIDGVTYDVTTESAVGLLYTLEQLGLAIGPAADLALGAAVRRLPTNDLQSWTVEWVVALRRFRVFVLVPDPWHWAVTEADTIEAAIEDALR